MKNGMGFCLDLIKKQACDWIEKKMVNQEKRNKFFCTKVEILATSWIKKKVAACSYLMHLLIHV